MKKLSFFLMAMLLALCTSTNVWAAKLTLDKLGSGLSSTSNATVSTTTITATGSSTDKYTLNYLQGKKQGDAILLAKGTDGGSSFISNKTPIPGNIKSITVYINSGASGKTTYHCAFNTTECTKKYTTGSTAVNIAGGKSSKYTCTLDGASYFCVSLGNNNNGQVLKLEVEYEPQAGSDVIVKTLKSIAIEGMTTTYEQGDIFKFDGTCTATYSVTKNDVAQADETAEVAPTKVSTPDMNTIGTKNVTVTYTEDEVSKEATYTITVNENVVIPATYTILLNNVLWNVASGQQEASVETMIGKSNDITFYTTKGSSQLYANETETRFYTNSDLKLSVPAGYVIRKIVFDEPSSKKWEGSITVNTGTYTDNTKTWTGNAQEVKFSFGAQNRIATATVTYEQLAADAVATPSIIGDDEFVESTEVSIVAEEGLKVYYTLDGTDPTNANTEYTAPFELTATTTVKAVAYDGEKASYIVSKTFKKLQVLTCEEAAELCAATESADKYVIRGYVTNIATAWSDQYSNISFWMADTKNGGKVFEAFRSTPIADADKAVKVGDYVEVIGKIVLYGTTPETTQGGTYTIIPAPEAGPTTGVDNVEATVASKKAIINGQLIIVKDGVQYNAQGQVIK